MILTFSIIYVIILKIRICQLNLKCLKFIIVILFVVISSQLWENSAVFKKVTFKCNKRLGGYAVNIEECYEKIGGDYADVSKRTPSVALIEKFIGIFLKDESFDALRRQLECANREEAFRAAHTLKGVCANLSFTKLLTSTARLTEVLRSETGFDINTSIELFCDVERDYEVTADAIRKYLDK